MFAMTRYCRPWIECTIVDNQSSRGTELSIRRFTDFFLALLLIFFGEVANEADRDGTAIHAPLSSVPTHVVDVPDVFDFDERRQFRCHLPITVDQMVVTNEPFLPVDDVP